MPKNLNSTQRARNYLFFTILSWLLARSLACFLALRSISEKVITFSELCEGHRHYWLDAVNFEEGKLCSSRLDLFFDIRSSQREKLSSSFESEVKMTVIMSTTYNFSLSLSHHGIFLYFSKLMSNFLYYTLFLVCTLQCTFMESWLIDAG